MNELYERSDDRRHNISRPNGPGATIADSGDAARQEQWARAWGGGSVPAAHMSATRTGTGGTLSGEDVARRFMQTKYELQALRNLRILEHEAHLFVLHSGAVPSSHAGMLDDPPEATPSGERVTWPMLCRYEPRLLVLVELTNALKRHFKERSGHALSHADVGNVWFGLDASPMSEGILAFVDDLVGPASRSMVAEVRTDEAYVVARDYLLALLTGS